MSDVQTTFQLVQQVMSDAWAGGQTLLASYQNQAASLQTTLSDLISDPDFEVNLDEIDLDFADMVTPTADWEDSTPVTLDYNFTVNYDNISAVPSVVAGYVTAQAVTSGTITAPTVLEPTIIIPESADVGDIFDQFQTEYLELVALLSAKFADFMSTYFPEEGLAYDAAQDWLLATINDPTGAAAAIWEDDRSRINDEATRKAAEVTAFWAAKRFPLPPGAAANQVLRIQQAAQSELAKSSRTAAIQSIELVKFAVDKALQLRQVALTAAKDYITALASGPDMASRMVNIGYDAQSKLISAAAQFYSARINAKQLILDADKTTASLAVDASKTTASLAIEAGKTNATLSTDASKTDASLIVDVNKAKVGYQIDAGKSIASLGLELGKTNASMQTEIMKLNRTLEVDIKKTEMQTELEGAKLELSAAQITADILKANAQTKAQIAMEAAKVAATQAQTLGQAAAAMLNNLHVSAGISSSSGRSIGYSYSGDVSSDVPAAT